MAYSRTTWVDGTTPAINATNLNNIEQGIVDLDTGTVKLTGDQTVAGVKTFSGGVALNDVGKLYVGPQTYAADAAFSAIEDGHVIQYLCANGSTETAMIRGWAAGGTWASRSAVGNSRSLLQLDARGYSGSNYRAASRIEFLTDDSGTISDTSMPGKIVFSTTPNGSVSLSERLRISSTSATFTVPHPGLKVDGTTSHGTLQINGAAGSFSSLQFLSGGEARWTLRRGSTAESGSNVGSDLELLRYDDAEGSLGTTLLISRSTGRVTIGTVTGSAGLELGSSGPRKMVGTGSPESSVTAPAGSIWIQTDHASLTYCKWVKLSGTGNTGWYPDFEGRWITYSGFSVSSSGTQPSGWTNTARYTQTGKTISMFFRSVASASVGTGTYRLGLPVTAATTDQPVLESSLWLQGGSQCSSLYIVWIPSGGSGSYAQVVAATGSSTYGSAVDWGAATPFTWANTYELRGSFTYEAA